MFTRTLYAACLLAHSIFSSAVGHDVAFFSSNSIMEVDWLANDVDTLSLYEINEFENAIAVLLYTTMKKESELNVGLLPDQKILAIDLHVKNVTKKESAFYLNAVVDVLYVAEAGIPDMASVLTRLSQQEKVEDRLLDDIYEILGGTAESVRVNFKTSEPPAIMLWELQEEHAQSSEKADKSLILACTLLCAALVLVTSVLFYVAGGWRDLREKLDEQLDWFKSNRCTGSSEEEDEESGGVDVADSQSYDGDYDGDAEATSPNGIIGAASKEDNTIEGLGINHTPERGISGYETDTPFSEMSAYTDSSRAPLGIASMRKMQLNGGRDSMLSLPPIAYQ